jgi:cyclase
MMAYLGRTREPSFFFQTDERTMELAKRLRRLMTPTEKLLWKRLKARNVAGAKFRRQHPIGCYVADFYSHESRLVIEVDGPIHEKPERREHDLNRDAEMERLGIKVLRFTNEEIRLTMSTVLARIGVAVTEGRRGGII